MVTIVKLADFNAVPAIKAALENVRNAKPGEKWAAFATWAKICEQERIRLWGEDSEVESEADMAFVAAAIRSLKEANRGEGQ